MTLVSGKVKKSGHKRGKLTPEEQFNRAWQRVQKQQRKNELFINEVTAFVADVEGQIGERERQYADALYAGCRRLLPFCQRKSLSNWQREVLLSWLTEDFKALVHSPFAAQVNLAALQAEMKEGIQALNAHILEQAEEYLEDDWEIAEEAPAEDTNGTRDMFEDAFAELEEEDDDDEWDDPFDDFFHQQRAQDEAKKEKTRSLSQLLKGSSVNKLFRKLARVLHPDLEQDDAAREHKHHLMVELIEAREGNDIPKIFSLYAEHVGESPLAELGGDLEIATQLLREQYEELQFRQQELLMENPRLEMVYRRFHYSNPGRVKRAIREHLAGLGQLIAFQEQWIEEATSLKKLKPYLEERYAAARMGGLLANFDILFDLPKNFR